MMSHNMSVEFPFGDKAFLTVSVLTLELLVLQVSIDMSSEFCSISEPHFAVINSALEFSIVSTSLVFEVVFDLQMFCQIIVMFE